MNKVNYKDSKPTCSQDLEKEYHKADVKILLIANKQNKRNNKIRRFQVFYIIALMTLHCRETPNLISILVQINLFCFVKTKTELKVSRFDLKLSLANVTYLQK